MQSEFDQKFFEPTKVYRGGLPHPNDQPLYITYNKIGAVREEVDHTTQFISKKLTNRGVEHKVVKIEHVDANFKFLDRLMEEKDKVYVVSDLFHFPHATSDLTEFDKKYIINCEDGTRVSYSDMALDFGRYMMMLNQILISNNIQLYLVGSYREDTRKHPYPELGSIRRAKWRFNHPEKLNFMVSKLFIKVGHEVTSLRDKTAPSGLSFLFE